MRITNYLKIGILLVMIAVPVVPHLDRKEAFQGSDPELDLARFLPKAADLKGWSPKESPQIYKGDDLFSYIDGGAEVYREYGFKQVIAQDYRDAKGRSISLEIYEMADSEAAFGMFSFKSSGKGRAATVGQDGEVEDYYLNFWKGPCLITVVGFDESPECRAGILEIAKAVDARLAATGARPKLLDVVPKEWTDVTRRVYLKGPLAVDNVSALPFRSLFPFEEGIAAERTSAKIFVFKFGTVAEAKQKFSETTNVSTRNPLLKDAAAPSPAAFEAHDGKGNAFYLRLHEDGIYLIVTPAGSVSRDDALRMLGQITP